MKKLHGLIALLLLCFVLNAPFGEASMAGMDGWKLIINTEVESKTNLAGFHNEVFGLTVGPVGSVKYTNNSGNNWSKGINSSACLFGMDIQDSKTAWICGNWGSVCLTKDGGANWKRKSNFNAGILRFIAFSGEIGWVATNLRIARTSNGGDHWEEVNLPEGCREIAAIALSTPEQLYLLSLDGILYITKNNGATWNSLGVLTKEKLLSDNVPTVALRFVSQNDGFAVFSVEGDKVFVSRTMDGGKTWYPQQLAGVTFGFPYLAKDGKTCTVLDLSKKVFVYMRFSE